MVFRWKGIVDASLAAWMLRIDYFGYGFVEEGKVWIWRADDE